jgi:WD40 repeat protein
VWDLTTRKVLVQFKGHEHRVVGAAFSPDGKRLVSTSWDDGQSHLRVWDATTGRIALVLNLGRGRRPPRAVFSPDGNRLAAVLDWSVVVWDAQRDRTFTERRWSRWHEKRARECEEAGKWLPAAFHLKRLLETNPSDASLQARRTRVLEKLHQAKAR